jgi:hypothetical protein
MLDNLSGIDGIENLHEVSDGGCRFDDVVLRGFVA